MIVTGTWRDEMGYLHQAEARYIERTSPTTTVTVVATSCGIRAPYLDTDRDQPPLTCPLCRESGWIQKVTGGLEG